MDSHNPTQEIQQELERELGNVQDEVGQVRALVQDAIVKLSSSFNTLRDQSNHQMTLVQSLTGAVETNNNQDQPQPATPLSGQSRAAAGQDQKKSSSINLRQFVGETDEILRSFVDHILVVSRQSMEMVHRIEDLSRRMNEISELLQDIRAIADQTNVLALNARIVSAKAGEAGAAFAVVADEVRKLSRRSTEFSDRIGGVVDRSVGDITNARRIVEAMASKDMSFAIESKGRVDDMMQEITKIDAFTKETLSKMSSVTAQLNHSVEVAVMSLQFEDMVTQVTQNMDRKFEILKSFAHTLCGGCPGSTGTPQDNWERVRDALLRQRQAFDEADRKAVGQDSLDAGDIELF
ncbi:MAG: methyl-accepting chemotaxis protein [Magnetococcus sp. WYHC-3]